MSVCVLLFLFSCVLNKLDPSILVWERDTLRFFMWILVFFTYICWVFLLVFMHLLSELLVFYVRLYSLVSFLNLLESCLCSNKFIGACVGTENVACGCDMSKNLHSLVDYWTLITWFFANVLTYLIVDGKIFWLVKLKLLSLNLVPYYKH